MGSMQVLNEMLFAQNINFARRFQLCWMGTLGDDRPNDSNMIPRTQEPNQMVKDKFEFLRIKTTLASSKIHGMKVLFLFLKLIPKVFGFLSVSLLKLLVLDLQTAVSQLSGIQKLRLYW